MRIEVNPNSIDDEIMGPDPDPPRPPERTKKLTIGRKKPPSRPPSCLSGVSGFVSAPSVSLLSASPRSGPRRYLTINQDCSAALLEGEEVSRKPRLVMKGLQPQSRIVLPPSPHKPVQQISRTHSPGKAQHQPPVSLSPMAQRLATSHNVIREDFSPSPVVPKNPRMSVVRNVFGDNEQESCLKKTPVVNLPRLSKQELINKAAKISKTAEESPDDNRLSISFQPTPARLRVTAGETETMEVDAEKDAPLPPPSENTFKIPSVPVPGPSASSKFKAPLPVPGPDKDKRLKGDVEPASNTGLVTETEHVSTEVRYLHSWVPRLKNGKVYVEGDLLDLDTSKDLSSELSRRYMTSRIVRRVNNVTIGTKKTLYVLEGELMLRDFDTSKIGQTPFFILDKFKHGFPANWEKLVKHWVRMETQNSKNSAYMSFISSTVLSNYSTLGNNSQANFSNISAITTMNTSGWVKQRMANLSVNRQSEITVVPSLAETEATLSAGVDEVIPHYTEGLEHEVQDAVTIVEKQDYLAPIEEEEKDDNTIPSDTEVSLKEKTVKRKSDGKRKLKSGNSLNSTLTRRNYATSKNIVEELSSTNKSEIIGLNGSFSLNDNYYCNECKFSTNSQKKMYDHCDLLTHKKKTRDIVKSRSKEKFMGCRGCGFSAHRNDDLFRHYGTKKHGKLEVQLKKGRKEEVVPKKPSGSDSKATKSIPGSDGEDMVEEMIDEPSPKKSKSRKNGKINPEIDGDNSEEELKRKTKATAVKRKSGSSKEVVNNKVKKSHIKTAPADRSSEEEMDKEIIKEYSPKKSKSRKKSSNGKVNPEIEGDHSEEELKRKSRATAAKRKSGSAKEGVTKKVKKSNIEPAPAVSNPDHDHESTVNQSMFGRQRKINRRYLRQSCVYNTPEEADPPKKSNKSKKTSTGDKENMTYDEMTEYEELNDLSSKKKEKAKKGSGIKKAKAGAAPKKATASEKPKKTEESLRRVVLNPFKKPSEEVVNEPAKPSKDVGDILKKVSAKPKTVKQRIQNVEALKEYNENHEDDMFNEPAPNSKSSMKISSLATLLSQDPDSDSDNDISVHSARTPVTGENI